jgi:hypothetical protein
MMDLGSFCKAPAIVDAAQHMGSMACADYWIYRYQTLIVGAGSITAAATAAFLLSLQLRQTRNQTSIAIGDLAPDFILRRARPDQQHEFEIDIINQNRRPIEVLTISVVSPDHISFAIPYDEQLPYWKLDPTREAKFNGFIVRGSPPGAHEFSQKTLKAGLFYNPGYQAESVDLTMEIHFEILGTGKRQAQTCALTNVEVRYADLTNALI